MHRTCTAHLQLIYAETERATFEAHFAEIYVHVERATFKRGFALILYAIASSWLIATGRTTAQEKLASSRANLSIRCSSCAIRRDVTGVCRVIEFRASVCRR